MVLNYILVGCPCFQNTKWPAVPYSQLISQIEKVQPFWTIISRDPDQTSRFCGISISCFCWSRVFGCSLLFSVQSMAWQATFDVITSWPFMRPPWKTGGKSLYALVPFWSWNTLQHYLVDVMMKQKSFFVQGNLNFALIEIISSFQYLLFAIKWTANLLRIYDC